MTCLFFSFLLTYKTRRNDFDLQLCCCISDALSIFLHLDDPERLEHTPGDVRPVVKSTTLTTR